MDVLQSERITENHKYITIKAIRRMVPCTWSALMQILQDQEDIDVPPVLNPQALLSPSKSFSV